MKQSLRSLTTDGGSSSSDSRETQHQTTSRRSTFVTQRGFVFVALFLCNGASSAFICSQRIVKRQQTLLRATAAESSSSSSSSSQLPEDEMIQGQLERARKVLAKSKALLNHEETGDDDATTAFDVPFFATSASMDRTTKRNHVTKTRNEETGLITADGEKMARLSEVEPWEMRSIYEVFDKDDEGGSSDSSSSVAAASASKALADRDVAASIFNLRKQMQTEDYRRIFDTRNRFIGEDT